MARPANSSWQRGARSVFGLPRSCSAQRTGRRLSKPAALPRRPIWPPTISTIRQYSSRDTFRTTCHRLTTRARPIAFLTPSISGRRSALTPLQRAKIVRDFERHALNDAYTVPLLWWNRIVVTGEKFKGWSMSPSHYLGQDLADVWLEK